MLIEISAVLAIVWLLALGHYLRPIMAIVRARKGQ